jgi:hypothetical protein
LPDIRNKKTERPLGRGAVLVVWNLPRKNSDQILGNEVVLSDQSPSRRAFRHFGRCDEVQIGTHTRDTTAMAIPIDQLTGQEAFSCSTPLPSRDGGAHLQGGQVNTQAGKTPRRAEDQATLDRQIQGVHDEDNQGQHFIGRR